MVKNKDRWSSLSMSERADLIKLYVNNGITSLDAIKKDYNSFASGGPIEVDEYGYPADMTPSIIKADYPRENEVWKRADASNADMVQRLKQGSSRATIQDWEDPRKVSTHKMMSAGNYVVGNVQNINGQLFDFTDPKHGFENPDRAAVDSAIERGDYIKFDTEGDARYFAEHYKKHYNSFGGGGHIKTDEYGYPADITPAVVTQDVEFNKFLITLPDNQRLTPEEDYHTYQYWKIKGKPKDFSEALNLGMYHYDSSDNSYHANSVAFDSKGVGHFMKPKHHPTVKYELDWYNKGTGTLEGGEQYPLQGEERKEWEDFRSQYQLDSTGIDYKYVPRRHYNSFGDGGNTDGDSNNNSTTSTERKLTLEEFLQAKADSTRIAALESSRNRTEGVEIVYPLSEGSKEINRRALMEYYYADPNFIGPILKYQNSPLDRTMWYQAKKELDNNCDYGLNCIGTATDNYPEDSREVVNKTFRENPANYGFVGVPYDNVLPGDIVQVGNHGMIFDSFAGDIPLFNYSNGNIGPDAYVKQGQYPADYYSVFRYVGTPTLIQQWTEEYNAQNKKFGGVLNSFDTGGPTKTGQGNTSEIPIEFELGVVDTPFWTFNDEPTPIEPEIPHAHNYMSEDDVYKEIDFLMSNTRDPKELPSKLDQFLRTQIIGNPNIRYYREGLINDLNHYIKYPYSSIVIHRNNQDIDKLNRATIDRFIPLEESSRTTLTNAGKSTGIELSTNMLDTLAYKGGIAGAELNRILGVPAQETSLGKFPGTTYIKPKDITALDDEHDFYGVSRSNFINNYGVNPVELMNNHYYYTNSADQATIGAIARKYGVGHDASGGWPDAYIDYNEITPEVEQAFKDAYWHSTRQRDKEDILVDPIVQAYELDATGNYNSKMKGHNELVEQRGIELWESPEIQKWWEETGKAWYEKGLQERKLKRNRENNLK